MLLAFFFNAVVVSIAVIIHFEMLNLLTALTGKISVSRRISIAFGVLGALMAHLLEVWIFGIAIYLFIHSGFMGSIEGNTAQSFKDCLYFSLTNYTSLGYGDIHPTGHVRFLAGVEALTGLVLIAWTASFVFLEMQKHWKVK